MSLLSKQDRDLVICALGITVEMEDPEDPAIMQMKLLLERLKFDRDQLD
jgi:hypothetical protein